MPTLAVGGAVEVPLRGDVRAVVIYSRSDGIVSWRACLDRAAAALVEIMEDEATWTG